VAGALHADKNDATNVKMTICCNNRGRRVVSALWIKAIVARFSVCDSIAIYNSIGFSRICLYGTLRRVRVKVLSWRQVPDRIQLGQTPSSGGSHAYRGFGRPLA